MLAEGQVIDRLKYLERDGVYVSEQTPLLVGEPYSLRVSAPRLHHDPGYRRGSQTRADSDCVLSHRHIRRL